MHNSLLLVIGRHISFPHRVNSLRPGDTYMHQKTGSSLMNVMACCLFVTRPLTCTNADLLSMRPQKEIQQNEDKFVYQTDFKLSSANLISLCSDINVLMPTALVSIDNQWVGTQTQRSALNNPTQLLLQLLCNGEPSWAWNRGGGTQAKLISLFGL